MKFCSILNFAISFEGYGFKFDRVTATVNGCAEYFGRPRPKRGPVPSGLRPAAAAHHQKPHTSKSPYYCLHNSSHVLVARLVNTLSSRAIEDSMGWEQRLNSSTTGLFGRRQEEGEQKKKKDRIENIA